MENEKSNNKTPTIRIKTDSDLDLITKLLKIYAIHKGEELRDFEIKVMKYYIKYGYSKETQDMIIEDTGKKLGAVKTTETLLRRKGYILKGEMNMRKSRLSPEMEVLRNNFILGKKKLLALILERDYE